MLAREGYLVLELCYNMPQYGQESLFTRKTPIDVSYFEEAINKLLSHPTCYGDKVCIIGHSKGCDLALGVASLLSDKVELTITNSGMISNPVGHTLKVR